MYNIHPITIKESTSTAAPVVDISNLILDWLVTEITCLIIDSSYQLSDHAAHQLDQVNGIILSDSELSSTHFLPQIYISTPLPDGLKQDFHVGGRGGGGGVWFKG